MALYRKRKIIASFLATVFSIHVFCFGKTVSCVAEHNSATFCLPSSYPVFTRSYGWGVLPSNIRAFEIQKLLVTLRYSKLNNAIARNILAIHSDSTRK